MPRNSEVKPALKRKKILPEHGDEITKQFFAFWPVTVGRERRWLCRVRVHYTFEVGKKSSGWKAVKFVELPGRYGRS